MRKTVLSLVSVAALALAGCNASNSSQPGDAVAPAKADTAGSPAATVVSNEVTGTVALRGPNMLSDHARLVINLMNVSASAAGSAPLASRTVAPAGQFPQDFKLTFNPDEVKQSDIYVVQAEVIDGERHYVMRIQAPVLTKGNKSEANIELVAEQTAGEKVLEAFKAEQKLLGGMKVSNGTKLEKDDSRGWQLFRQAGQVEFIRELVDYGDKGFTSTDYAYRDGKAWVIVQETKPSREGKPTAIDRAGWDESGLLVLKQREEGNNVQPLDGAAVAKLQKQAKDILSLATGGKNK